MAAFHKEHTHGRVFHGLEARRMLEMEKRDSHGSDIKLNVPDTHDNKYNFIHMAGQINNIPNQVNAIAAQENNQLNANPNLDDSIVTIVSQIYVTEPKTFSGPAIYVTKTPHASQQPAAAAPTTTLNAYESAKAKQHSTPNAYESLKSKQHKGHRGSSSGSAQPTTTPATAFAGIPLTTSRQPTVLTTPLAANTPTISPVTNEISNESHGMSSGGKAGLAIGILAIIGIAIGCAFVFIRRRKQRDENGEKIDEKHASQGSFFSGTAAAVGAPAGEKRASMRSVNSASSRTGATAPRLSLRPITSLFPNMLSGSQTPSNGPAMSEKPRNPFADGARPGSPSNPFEEAAQNMSHHSSQPSVDGSEPGTPRNAQFGTAAAVAVGAGGPPRGPNNVHRVQLDFKPSMDDELELRSGQIVRMLHEYDDGWALCIRMDRSQQGVCPRTCLSKLPVKPRPNGPPPSGANGRPMGPPPPGMRGPPPPGSNRMMPRPLTPNGRERSNTAGGMGSAPSPVESQRPRSQSVTTAPAPERPVSPLEGSIPARKPVPGQAI